MHVESQHPPFTREIEIVDPPVVDGVLSLDLRLSARVLRGTVTDGSQRPVGRARVEGRGPQGEFLETTSGDDGRFELPGLASGQNTVWAEAEDLGISERANIDVGEADPADVTLVVSKLRTWKGRLMAADGQPVAGARLEVEAPGAAAHWASARSDALGSFEVGMPREAEHVLVRVAAPSHVLWSACLPLPRPGRNGRPRAGAASSAHPRRLPVHPGDRRSQGASRPAAANCCC